MKAKYIQILIGVGSTAILALIGIQLYWASSSIELKEDELKRNTMEALHATVEKLEQIETVKKLKSHQQGRYFFIDEDAETKLNEAGKDTSFDYMIMKEVMREGDQVQIKITEESQGQTHTRTAERNVEELNATDTLNDLLDLSLKYDNNAENGYLRNGEGIQLNEELRNRLMRKKAFVGDIVKSLIEVDLYQPIEERLNYEEVDSILSHELHARGINASFAFGVANPQGKLMLSSNAEWDSQIVKSGLSDQLFPNDVIRDPYYLHVYFTKQTGYLLKTNWMMLMVSALIVLAITYIFYYTVKTIISQKRNSEIKNDFINNMTHELKTPISTISLACEALKDPDLNTNRAIVTRYVGMINDENSRLGLLVEEVLQSAVLDKGEFKLKKDVLELNDILKSVVDKFGIQVRERQGHIKTNYPAERLQVIGDRVHLSNVFSNLLDNANKYSKESPVIEMNCERVGNEVKISVKDHGIGISKENQMKIFDKLYRVPTGNVHDVKGFGLGLSYVKIIIDRLGGNIEVKSQIGKGSTFIIYLPLYENN